MSLKPDGVGGERAARKPRPSDRALAFLYSLFARPTFVVEGDDVLGRTRHVGDDEADARIEFARMPLDFRDDAARLRPASRSVGEVRVGSPDIKRGAADRAFEQIADAFLQDTVGRQPDRVFDPFAFEILVDLGIGEACGGVEVDARQPCRDSAPRPASARSSQPSALWTFPGRRTQRSRSPNWLNTHSG